ncbi:hypothetical protein BDD39_001371 [Saccharococcus thermophilus]|uniref:Transposase n=1 Tax=Saccharococcus thermophilus TaxID=29396 RepID=A0A846MCY0_9BACL|nr:hypothetical protein [Saccharococcus thermophilus]
MYIRRVTRKNKDGTTVAYLQLAHNEWDPKDKYAKAKVIYLFGREDEVDRAVLERLAKSISRFLSPEQVWKTQELAGEASDFRFQSCKRLGGIWLLDQLWRQVGLDDILRTLFASRHCRLRSHPSYGKYLRQLKDGTLRIDKQAVRKAEKYDGKYLIRTSDDTLSAEDVALGYKQLVDIEQAFRTLKSTLELRPMYHRLEDRIRAHVPLSWLALLLVRISVFDCSKLSYFKLK